MKAANALPLDGGPSISDLSQADSAKFSLSLECDLERLFAS